MLSCGDSMFWFYIILIVDAKEILCQPTDTMNYLRVFCLVPEIEPRDSCILSIILAFYLLFLLFILCASSSE